jgi:hypothetical protein
MLSEGLKGQDMNGDQRSQPMTTLEAARWELRSLPIPWDDIEQAALRVSSANPRATRNRLVNLIVVYRDELLPIAAKPAFS